MFSLNTNFFTSLSLVALLLIILSILILFLERKFIGIAQKRLGISFLGRNGWLHLPADIVKFWAKDSYKNLNLWFFSPSTVLFTLSGYYLWNLLICLFFINNDGFLNYNFFSYQTLVYFGYANLTTLYLVFLISSFKSKYAILGSLRLLLTSIFMEFSFILNFVCLYIYTGGYSFNDFSSENSWSNLTLALPIVSLIFFIYTIYEAKRAPFDHAEAESELVAGHMVEFSGRTLLFFFFSEYVHLYLCMFLVMLLCLGDYYFSFELKSFFFSDNSFNFDIPYRTDLYNYFNQDL